jgi:superfamily II DNA or RNA helicase
MKHIEQIISNLEKYIPRGNFREGQFDFYQKIKLAIIANITRMYIEGPTGIGKTFLQSTLADAIINGTTGINILILVPKKNLLYSMKKEFQKFAPHLAVGLVGDGNKQYGNHVTIMTYQSFLGESQSNLDKYSAIFLDEAHKSMGKQTKIKVDNQTHVLLLGVTATSYYNEEKNLENWLGYCAHTITIPEAVQLGMIANIQYILEKVRIDIDEKSPDETATEYTEKVGTEIIRQGGNIAAAETYNRYFRSKGARFIMFALTVNQGHDLVAQLRSHGISAEIIHGNTKNQQELFDAFANNEFQVLVGIDVIKEGFDDPGISGVMFTYPIKSLVGLIQGGGRSTRICDWIPNKMAYIVQMMFNVRGQVFYSSVLNGETIIIKPPKESEKTPNPKSTPIDTEPWGTPTVERVIVDHVEMVQVIKDYTDATTRKVWSFEEIQTSVRNIGIKSSHDYANNYSGNKWPSQRTLTSMPEFPKKEDGSNDWDKFLEAKKSFAQIQTEVIAANIESSSDYVGKASKNKWPSKRTLTSMPEFPKKGDGSNDWASFLSMKNLETKIWTFLELQREVRGKKVFSSGDYRKKYSSYKWPSTETLINMPEFPKKGDGSNDWDDFLDTKNLQKDLFLKIQTSVRNIGIKSSHDYTNNRSDYKWPSTETLINMPEFPKKGDGSNDWDKFLGITRKSFLELQAEIRALSIKSSGDYRKKYSENSWPAPRTLASMSEFPKKDDGGNDWKTFLGI